MSYLLFLEVLMKFYWFGFSLISLQKAFNIYPRTKSSQTSQSSFLHVIDRYVRSSFRCCAGNFREMPSAPLSSLLRFYGVSFKATRKYSNSDNLQTYKIQSTDLHIGLCASVQFVYFRKMAKSCLYNQVSCRESRAHSTDVHSASHTL